MLVIIWLPLLFRLLLLARPARQAVAKVAPHAGWALKQLRELPIKGLRLLILNETLALLAPPVIVLLYRQLADPIGWRTWDEVSLIGGAVLMFLTLVWLVLDLMRIGRTRRMLLAVIKQDVDACGRWLMLVLAPVVGSGVLPARTSPKAREMRKKAQGGGRGASPRKPVASRCFPGNSRRKGLQLRWLGVRLKKQHDEGQRTFQSGSMHTSRPAWKSSSVATCGRVLSSSAGTWRWAFFPSASSP